MRTFIAAGMFLLAAGSANAALISGDIAFTSFNADEDAFSLVPFVNIGANTTVFFTDNEWNGSAIGAGGAFNANESYLQWNTGASVINAGTVVRFNNVDDNTLLGASVGTFGRVSVSGNTNWGISASADTIYAYLGSSATAPTVFLTAITNSNFNGTDGSLAGTNLVQGVNAIDLNGALNTSPDYAEYNGLRSGLTSFAAYKPLIANTANWTVDATNGVYATAIPNTTNLTTVPVPAAAWLLGSALVGLAGFRRRKV